MKMGRPNLLTVEEVQAKEALINAANAQHDAKYGQNYDRMGWRVGFEPACFKRDRESIWAWHRKIEPKPTIGVDGI